MRISETNTLDALRGLGATVTVPTAGQFYGLSRPRSYDLAKRGEFPVQVRSVGSRFYVLTSDLARALGIEPRDLLGSETA